VLLCDDSDPCGVVTAVLKATEAFKQDLYNITLSDGTNDSTHDFNLPTILTANYI
jgi:DNA-binding IscR family transcriptional regulator|tara:strand:+ start:651 stop:815 length:165 start_codon:yes stop_codon:yes gene_type:complete